MCIRFYYNTAVKRCRKDRILRDPNLHWLSTVRKLKEQCSLHNTSSNSSELVIAYYEKKIFFDNPKRKSAIKPVNTYDNNRPIGFSVAVVEQAFLRRVRIYHRPSRLRAGWTFSPKLNTQLFRCGLTRSQSYLEPCDAMHNVGNPLGSDSR